MIGAKLTPLLYGKNPLINKNRSRVKVYEPYEDSFKHYYMINAIYIFYGCVFQRSSKQVIKGSRVESIKKARKEHKKLLEEEWEKIIDSIVFFLKNSE